MKNARPAAALTSVLPVQTLRLFQLMEFAMIAHILAIPAAQDLQSALHAFLDSTSSEPHASPPAPLEPSPEMEFANALMDSFSLINVWRNAPLDLVMWEDSVLNVNLIVLVAMDQPALVLLASTVSLLIK